MEKQIEEIKKMIEKAANAFDGNEAMKYSQAALNAAHALAALRAASLL